MAACQNCKSALSANRRKHHCRHCGRIFCSDCVTKTVASGPTGRDELYKNRSSRKNDSHEEKRPSGSPILLKIASENRFSGKTYFYTIVSRPAKVCDVCHTLLVQNSAPYFSTEAPHN